MQWCFGEEGCVCFVLYLGLNLGPYTSWEAGILPLSYSPSPRTVFVCLFAFENITSF